MGQHNIEFGAKLQLKFIKYILMIVDCIEEILTECPYCMKRGDAQTYKRTTKIIQQPKYGGKECSPLSQTCYLTECPEYCNDQEGNSFAC